MRFREGREFISLYWNFSGLLVRQLRFPIPRLKSIVWELDTSIARHPSNSNYSRRLGKGNCRSITPFAYHTYSKVSVGHPVTTALGECNERAADFGARSVVVRLFRIVVRNERLPPLVV